MTAMICLRVYSPAFRRCDVHAYISRGCKLVNSFLFDSHLSFNFSVACESIVINCNLYPVVPGSCHQLINSQIKLLLQLQYKTPISVCWWAKWCKSVGKIVYSTNYLSLQKSISGTKLQANDFFRLQWAVNCIILR